MVEVRAHARRDAARSRHRRRRRQVDDSIRERRLKQTRHLLVLDLLSTVKHLNRIVDAAVFNTQRQAA